MQNSGNPQPIVIHAHEGRPTITSASNGSSSLELGQTGVFNGANMSKYIIPRTSGNESIYQKTIKRRKIGLVSWKSTEAFVLGRFLCCFHSFRCVSCGLHMGPWLKACGFVETGHWKGKEWQLGGHKTQPGFPHQLWVAKCLQLSCGCRSEEPC